MFRVYLRNQGKEYPIYEPLDDTLHIYNPVLTQEMGLGGAFTFHVMANHPYADKIHLLKSELVVYRREQEIFCGRVLKPEYSIQNMISITCEGNLCYLVDSQQRPYEFKGSVSTFIERLLEIHNSQVDDYKKIYPGTITVTDGNDETVRSETAFSNTLESLMHKLVEPIGGYLRIQNESGKKYLDYLWDYGGINQQVIRFGENMLELNHYMDAASIITCLIPMGAEVEYTNELGEKHVKTVDITSVNDGRDYIQDHAGIETYGKIWESHRWNDITEPDKLLAKAKEYLKEAAALPDTMQINALDLSLVKENVQEFHLGYWTHVSSVPHGIEKRLLLRKRVINLLDPADGSIELGGVAKTFTKQMIKNQQHALETIHRVADSASLEINRKVENATNLITGGLGGYVVLDNIDPDTGEKMHPWRILIMNTPDKETAKNVIQFNQNGIGFSTTGINGPYTNAWTIDGNLVADFITTGTMLADRIRGGKLELGGSGLGQDGEIIVKNSAGKVVCTLDKTGLHTKEGTIEGMSIQGSDIRGGTINIGRGTFEVNEEGEVIIESGRIDLGLVAIDGYGIEMGAFRIAYGEANAFLSQGDQLQIWADHYDWEGPTIIVGRDTVITQKALNARYINADEDLSITSLPDETGWEPKWMSVKKNIIELWNKIEEIENSIY